jgi:hypothetical protein
LSAVIETERFAKPFMLFQNQSINPPSGLAKLQWHYGHIPLFRIRQSISFGEDIITTVFVYMAFHVPIDRHILQVIPQVLDNMGDRNKREQVTTLLIR